MTVGIVGLGLIGGSFAKAYHEAGHRVLAFDTDASVTEFAMLSGAVDGILTDEALPECDLILIAVYPGAAVDYLRQHGAHIGSKPVVIDCCGTKRTVCSACFPLAKQYGFTYLGGHPMAGTHNSGFKYASPHHVPQRTHGAGAGEPQRHRPAEPGERTAGSRRVRPVFRHHGGAARRDDCLHLPAGSCGVQRLYQKPHRQGCTRASPPAATRT